MSSLVAAAYAFVVPPIEAGTASTFVSGPVHECAAANMMDCLTYNDCRVCMKGHAPDDTSACVEPGDVEKYKAEGYRCLAEMEAPSDKGSDPSHFTIGVNMQHPSSAAQYAAAGINTYFGIDWPGVSAESLQTLAQNNISLYAEQSDDTLKFKDSPVIVGWDIGWDEPDNAQSDGHGGYNPCLDPSKIQARYNEMKQKDSRPVYMCLGRGVSDTTWGGRGKCTGKTEMYAEYLKGTDVAAYDIYPDNTDKGMCTGNLTCVYQGLENLKAWDPRKGSRPTPRVMALETGPISKGAPGPTPADLRSEAWMTIVSGAMGINYFVHYFGGDCPKSSGNSICTDYLLHNPPMLAAVTKLNAEITSLAPALNAPNCSSSAATVDDDRVAILARACTSAGMYLFAVSLADATVHAKFSVAAGASAATLGYDEAARTIAVSGGAFSDTFTKYQVHLYRLS